MTAAAARLARRQRHCRLRWSVAVAAALAMALTGCVERPDLGTTSNSGAVTEFAAPVPVGAFSGTTTDGGTFDSNDYRGRVLVVNIWYVNCPPCRREAPDLKALAEHFVDDGVQFIGINTRDSAATARSFEDAFGIGYPSILDARSGAAQLELSRSDTVAPNATPTTLVIDRRGRVTARILGQVPDRSILQSLVESALRP